ESDQQALNVLRYELETFVCDGQYKKGMAHILETYLKNIGESDQPAVWVSGFYGSGKSHMVKMLRALWNNTVFPDGATARGIADLPDEVQTLSKELSTQAKRHGGLHAASGTLGAGASDSVRLALLRIVFKSVGLPAQYPVARFVMWLKNEGIYEAVRQKVEEFGADWEEELDNFHVAEDLHAALAAVKPNLFSSPAACTESLNNEYPHKPDISNDEMIKAITQALKKDGKFPLTLIVLDEVQQYIGQNTERTNTVQEMVEACCKQIGGKLLFVGTGQTAVTSTPNLKKLEGRFTVRIELSDTDVDTVVRKVILPKKPEAMEQIKKVAETNLGEISRHLANTSIEHRQEDMDYLPQDYPILPTRRRFWEHSLRALDPTGTDSQLRNQLSMTHKVIQTNLDEQLGNVVPGDYIYFDTADRLLQARKLPRKVHEKTMHWIEGTADEQLMARAAGLVFLINKLADNNKEIGIRATVDTIADLMVQDLPAGSSDLRARLPGLLDSCELLMKVGEDYRIQTAESAAWNDEFHHQKSQLANEAYRLETERDDRIRQKFNQLVGNISINQGESKVTRNAFPVFENQLPADSDRKVYIWVRDGWSVDENTVKIDARQAGHESSTVFVHIPKRSADDLRQHLMNFRAAAKTLDIKGVPNTPEGREAQSAMQTTKQNADERINELLGEMFSGAHVFQGGGNEIMGESLKEKIQEAAANALQRLYPQFSLADHSGWAKVYTNAKQGAPDALQAVGDKGEPTNNPLCKAILSYIAGGKKGADIREHFESPPYGWPWDAIAGALQVLLTAGSVTAKDEQGANIDPRELERKSIGKAAFNVVTTTITTAQRIQIRKLFQKAGFKVKQGEETIVAPQFVQALAEIAEKAGGDPPKPEPPDTSSVESIRLSGGNEQLLAIYEHREELKQAIDRWQELADQIDQRWPSWTMLQDLLKNAKELKGIADYQSQARQIEEQRLLLSEPDPVKPLLANVAQVIRDALNQLDSQYSNGHEQGMGRLEKDTNWQQLTPEQKHELLSEQNLTNSDKPEISVETTEDILQTLRKYPLAMLKDRIAAMSARFDKVLEEAALLLEPEVKFVKVPRRTLKTQADVDQWVEEVRQKLMDAVENGPVGIS
ncbi:MAG: BREX system P-loop protein BrxC, partial [bacterium]